MIWMDIETRARKDVVKYGLYAHAPTVEQILCIRYALGDAEIREWRGAFADGEDPLCADDPPEDLLGWVEDGHLIAAHNAAYERVVLRDSPAACWWPDIPIERWFCTASWAASFNLPRGLGQLSKLLLPPERAKMVDVASGVKYMWHADRPMTNPDDMDTQSMYCAGDVAAMRDCMALLPPVDPDWLAEYHAAEYVNDRGVLIDRELAEAIVAMKPRIDKELREDLDRATGGTVKLRGPTLLKWLQETLPEDLQEALVVNRKIRENYGFRTRKKISADKVARAQVLEVIEDRPDLQHVRRALDAFEQANKAAVSKFAAALQRVDDDGFLRGQFMFSGAGQTGRFSSTGMQVHNLKRDVDPQAVEIIQTIKEHFQRPGVIAERYEMTVNEACSRVLRPTFIAPVEALLYWGDWSSVEARKLPWLSADPDAEEVLDVFRNKGDVYIREAINIYGRPDIGKDDPERQVGKVAVLALGYQGGVGAFQSMAAGYGVELSDNEADTVKNVWRTSNPWAVRFWARLEAGAMRAVLRGGKESVDVGRLTYQYLPGLCGGTLICWLPDGGWVAYPEAKVQDIQKFEDGPVEPALTFLHPTYGPSATYGGALAENATQASCARLLRRALIRCEEERLNVVLHIHDEIVGEADEVRVDHDAGVLRDIMNDVPAWAAGLPLDADVDVGARYKVKRLAE